MRLESVNQGDVTIVEIHPGPSRIVDGREGERLASALRALLQEGKKKILVDLGRISLMTSRPIGSLVGVQAHAFKRGAAIYLCNVDKRIQNVLVIMWLVRVLNVLGTRAEALRFLSALDLQLRPGCFEFHSPEVKDFTARLSYLWPNGDSPVSVNQGAAPSSGRAMVHVVDAGGAEIFAHSAADPGAFDGVTGRAGDWRIELDLFEYSGKLDFEMHNV